MQGMEIISNYKARGVGGFTLIEMVMVIVVIGILAAAAIPRFANLSDQARAGANKGYAGAFASAVAMTHSAWAASGGSAVDAMLEGNVHANLNSMGWPVAAQATIAYTTAPGAVRSDSCASLFNNMVQGAPTAVDESVADAACGTEDCYMTSTFVELGHCIYRLTGKGETTPLDGNYSILYHTETGEVIATP